MTDNERREAEIRSIMKAVAPKAEAEAPKTEAETPAKKTKKASK